jgi:hypothetical protein
MPNFAISDGSKIVNVIVSDSKKIAEEVTGLSAIKTDGEPWIDWTLEEEGWRMPPPYPSWIWNSQEWEAPIPMPEKEGFWYSWNEESMSWDEHEIIIEEDDQNGN